MADLLSFIRKELINYSEVQGECSKILIQKNSTLTFSELYYLHEGIKAESQFQPNIDINKFYCLCAANAILCLPHSFTSSSQEILFAPEHIDSCIDYLLYLRMMHQLHFRDAEATLVRKITRSIGQCDDFEMLLKWIKGGLSCRELLKANIRGHELFSYFNPNSEFFQNAYSREKTVIFGNLEKLKSLQELNIYPSVGDLIVDFALNWINMNKAAEKDQDFSNNNRESSIQMLEFVNNLKLSNNEFINRRKNLNEYFWETESIKEALWRNKRSMLQLLEPIYVSHDVSVIHCKILWKGQEIDAAIKTYKDFNYKYRKRCEKEVEILSNLSGKSQYFLCYYGHFYDTILENEVMKCCSNIVMEYCPQTLSSIYDKREELNQRFTPMELYHICTDLLVAFQDLTNFNVYHMDIKPGNILIDKNNQLKIADFNISDSAERPESSSRPTSEHEVYGTLSYMAPEKKIPYINWEREAKYRPERADVFSLGLIFYQLAVFKDIRRFTDYPERRDEVLEDVEIGWLRSLIYDMLDFDYKTRPTFKKAWKKLMQGSTDITMLDKHEFCASQNYYHQFK